ncbi:MAG: sulfite exporter TauE/SafE family protein [Acetobacteraceae bacterium]|nr:sulfite exporter TauE/SafE family protein [Acetobacteraceae bacterium]
MGTLHSFAETSVLYSLSGLLVGLLVGLTGVGGGSLMTPLLVLLFGVHPTTAVGTDLLYAAVTKSSGTLVHGLNKNVEWRVSLLLAAGSIPSTALTLLVLSQFDLKSSQANHVISLILGIALMFTALSLIFRRGLLNFASRHIGELPPRQVIGLTILTGAILGSLVSISSVGAGAIGVTALILLYPRLPIARIIGSDIAHAVPLTLLAGIGHWVMGTIDWGLLGSLLVGSIPGIVFGSYISARVPETVLRPILAGTLLIVASRLVS